MKEVAKTCCSTCVPSPCLSQAGGGGGGGGGAGSRGILCMPMLAMRQFSMVNIGIIQWP